MKKLKKLRAEKEDIKSLQPKKRKKAKLVKAPLKYKHKDYWLNQEEVEPSTRN